MQVRWFDTDLPLKPIPGSFCLGFSFNSIQNLHLRKCKQIHTALKKILSNLNIEELNEMQQASLEANAKNENVILLSATGSGKTLAFLLPVLKYLNPE